MKNKKFESGQIFVFLVIAMVALLGFTALAIDGSLIYNQKRQDQSTADSAALAGAASAARYINSAKSFTCDSTVTGGTAGVDVAAKATAASVGSSTVTFTCGTDATTGKQYLDIHTVVTSTVKTYFLKIVSSQAQTTTAGATARVTPGTSGPLFGGSALVSLSTSGCGMNFVHSVITLKGGGLFDNSSTSTGDGALCSDWGPTIVISDTGCIGVVGSLGSNFTNSGSNTKTGYCSPMPTQLAKTDTDKIFAKILLPSNTPTCSTPGVWDATNRVATAGDFSSTGLHLTSSGGTLNSGTYCFGSTGSFVVDGGSVTTTGDIVMVFTGSNGATLGGGSQYTFSSLIIYDNNGYWDVQGSDTLTAKVFRFYSSGTGTFHIAGGGIVTLNDGFFYLTGGTLAGDGRSTINLYAPTSGDYKGIAIFSPVNNHTTFHVQGQSILNITGSILIPGSELLLDGSAVVTSLNSQVVCNDIVTGGSSSLTTTYKASQNYSGAGSSTLIDLNH